jgi:hypothetical protein
MVIKQGDHNGWSRVKGSDRRAVFVVSRRKHRESALPSEAIWPLSVPTITIPNHLRCAR